MSIATVVVAPRTVIDTAVAWARRGLVANSLWVSSDDFPGVDPDRPNAIPVKLVGYGFEPIDDTLPLQLAGLGALQETRVVWVRLAKDTNNEVLGELAAQLREILPHVTNHWIDIVVPEKRTDERFAPLAGHWVQFYVYPSDFSAPDHTDAGWDCDLAVPLHVTLALAGILGGSTTDLPWARLDADQYHLVRAFSRLVDGGLEAQRQAHQFVHATLPITHAAEQHKDTGLPASSSEAAEIVDQATACLLASEDGALVYEAPAQSEFEGHPRVSVKQHLLLFLRFIPTGLMTLLNLQPEPNAEMKHRLEFDDLGYNIGPEVEVVEWTSGIPDFAALEAKAATEAALALAQASRHEGARPPSGVWEPLARLSTVLVDGGTVTLNGWDMEILTTQQRRLSLSPELVTLGEAEAVSTRVPELAKARNAAVASEALFQARRYRGQPIKAQPDATRVTATAMRLADQANSIDAAELGEQLEQLGEIAPPPRPVSLLERVHGAVLGGLIRSRLDAGRWGQFAVTSPPGKVPTWGKANVILKWVMRVVIVLLVLVGVAWWLWREKIASALSVTIGLVAGLAIIAGALVLVTILLLYQLFRRWAAFMERGRRRLELMALWLGRALKAQGRHSALVNTERVAGRWSALLSSVPGQREPAELEVFETEAELAPMSLRIGHPRYRRNQMEHWLANAGAKPGWRLEALQLVTGYCAGLPADRALAWLAEDRGLPGGRLDNLAEELDEHQAQWRAAAQEQIAAEVLLAMAKEAKSIDVFRNPKLPLQETQTEAFLHELTPPEDDRDDWPDDSDHSWVVAAGAGEVRDRAVLIASPALCTGRFRIQVADSDHIEPDNEPDTDTDSVPVVR